MNDYNQMNCFGKYRLLTAIVLVAAFLFPFPSSAQNADQFVDVVATGVGLTLDEAHRAADRAAVEQVVGSMVDTTTLTEKGEVVDDKILSFSAGLIADSKIVGAPKKDENGLITVKVKATVRKTALRERLAGAKLITAKIDGESLWSQMTSAQDNLADAEAMIKDVLAKHITCVNADFVRNQAGNPKIDFDPKTGETFVSVRAWVDMAKYAQFAKEVVDKLKPMALKSLKIISKGNFQFKNPSTGKQYSLEYYANGYVNFEIPGLKNDRTGSASDYLLIMTNYRTGVAQVLWFDKSKLNVIRSCMETGSVAFSVTASDATGLELAERQVPIDNRHNNNTYDSPPSILFSKYAILPLFGGQINSYSGLQTSCGSMDYASKTEETFRVSLGKFTPDELKSATKLEIKIGHMKDGQFIE